MVTGDIENAFNGTFLLVLFDVTIFCPLPQNQRQRTQNNGFSGSGFAGNNRKTGVEIDIERVY